MTRHLLLLVLILSFCASTHGAEATKINGDNEFSGKIVAIQLSPQAQFVLEDVRIVKCGDESFFAGTGVKRTDDDPDKKSEWWQGLPVRINIRFVASYITMTPEQWKNQNGKLPAGETKSK